MRNSRSGSLYTNFFLSYIIKLGKNLGVNPQHKYMDFNLIYFRRLTENPSLGKLATEKFICIL